jgi:hypothetical protein
MVFCPASSKPSHGMSYFQRKGWVILPYSSIHKEFHCKMIHVDSAQFFPYVIHIKCDEGPVWNTLTLSMKRILQLILKEWVSSRAFYCLNTYTHNWAKKSPRKRWPHFTVICPLVLHLLSTYYILMILDIYFDHKCNPSVNK